MKPGDHPEFFRFPAPEGQSRESTIRLDKEGRFWHDGALVEHPRLAEAMHGWIARHPDDGRPILTNGYDWTYFTVEDTPFVVRSLRVIEPSGASLSGEAREGRELRLVLSNGEQAAPEALEAGPDGALYARVTLRGQRWEARFTRFAQTELGPLLEEGPGGVGVRSGGRLLVPTPRRSP